MQAINLKHHNSLPTWQEQGLCIGNSFWVTATNGLDICRRLNLIGYCRSTDLLSDVVEHTVLSSGGEIVIREHKSSRCASLLPCCATFCIQDSLHADLVLLMQLVLRFDMQQLHLARRMPAMIRAGC